MPAEGTVAPKMLRLVFEYEGDTIRLIGQYPVESDFADHAPDRARTAGYYVDSRNAANQPLARVPVHGAFRGSAEVFPEQAGQTISRIDTDEYRGAFSVIVPLPNGTDRVTVVRVDPVSVTGRVPAMVRPVAITNEIRTTDLATFAINT